MRKIRERLTLLRIFLAINVILAGLFVGAVQAGWITINGQEGWSGLFKVWGNIETTGTIELGNPSDTTLSRSAAGILAVEGINVQSALTDPVDDKASPGEIGGTTPSRGTFSPNVSKAPTSVAAGFAGTISSAGTALTFTEAADDALVEVLNSAGI